VQTRQVLEAITDDELQNVVNFIAKQGKPTYEVAIHQQLQKAGDSFDEENSGCGEDEELIQQCIEIIRSEQKASVSLMQRRLRLGYTRAARIMDELEARGIVGPNKGAEPRDILIDLDGTGADGLYTFELRWTLDDQLSGAVDRGAGEFAAIQDAISALGLHLQAQKVPVEIVVVDHAERVPAEN